ncbi:ATP-binding protein [Streptomyces sp. NPDC057445]|uniref:ATP-binding protein n=1 Tax=Streptomyces sp. NPDC057445 TaxID=3346136 RepID=UPI0036A449B4
MPGKGRAGQGGRPARYCSGACRQRAFRRRAARPGQKPAPARLPGGAPPGALDSFVGRRHELSRLRTLFRTARLLTLTGPGGVGKTRLALEFTANTPALFVELDSLDEGDRVPAAVAAALGVGERGGRTGVDVLAHALGDRRTLLVLDNCEHLAEACARLAADLLGRCPELRILATSREVLRVPGEVVFRVGELSLTAAGEDDDPAAVVKADAVRLFVERATGAAPGFGLNPSNARAVAEICRRLDGMPLAIELAARRAAALPPADILAGLDDQLSLLTDGSRTGPGRHRELAAAIDWSHRLLDPQERILFRRLSVLVGGFDAEGAAAVCTEKQPQHVLRVLLALEAKSLVVRMPGGDGAARFRQLSAIRAYALDRLTEAGELHTTWQRAVDWLTRLLEPAADQVFADQSGGPTTQERENLAAAVAHTTHRHGSPPVPLALALARIRFQQEQPTAARALLTQLLGQNGGSRTRASALALAARAAAQQADREAALRHAEQAVAVARSLGHPAELANALDARAAARLCRSEFAEAVADLDECLTFVTRLGRPHDEAWSRHHLAWALLHTGRAAEADELMSRCLPPLRKQSSWCRLAAALHTAGAARLALRDLHAAEGLFAEALRAVPGESFHALYPLEGLAVAAAERGEMRRAVRLFTAAAEARDRLDTEPEAAWQCRIEASAAAAAAALPSAVRDTAAAGALRLTWPRLIAYALRHRAHEGRATDGSHTSPLTGREAAVAALVADGLTNREIAVRLGLSASTVSTHLDNVRDKLGLRSRTQIALWIRRHEVS